MMPRARLACKERKLRSSTTWGARRRKKTAPGSWRRELSHLFRCLLLGLLSVVNNLIVSDRNREDLAMEEVDGRRVECWGRNSKYLVRKCLRGCSAQGWFNVRRNALLRIFCHIGERGLNHWPVCLFTNPRVALKNWENYFTLWLEFEDIFDIKSRESMSTNQELAHLSRKRQWSSFCDRKLRWTHFGPTYREPFWVVLIRRVRNLPREFLSFI